MGHIFSGHGLFSGHGPGKKSLGPNNFPMAKKWQKSGHCPNYFLKALNTKSVKKRKELEQVSRGSCNPLPPPVTPPTESKPLAQTLRQMLKKCTKLTLTFGQQQ